MTGYGPHRRVDVTRVIAVAVGLLILAARAPVASGRSGKAKTLVLLAARNRPALAKRAVQAVRSQLSDTKVVLCVVWVNRLAPRQVDQVALSRRHAAKPGVLAVAWYDANQPDKVLLFAARSGRLVVRRVSGPTVSGRLEALAIIVRSSMLALLAGQPLPVGPRARPRPPPRRPLRVVPRPRRRRRVPPRRATATRPRPRPPASGWRFGLGLEAGYVLSGYSTDIGAVHGGALAVTFHLRQGWSVLLGYRVVQKLVGEAGPVRMALQPHPLSLGARWRHRWGRFELGLTLSLEMDYMSLETTTDDITLRTSRDKGDLLWSTTLMVSGALALSGRLKVFLAAGAQVGLNWRRYNLDDGTEPQMLVEPWPVLPCMIIGLSADLI